MTRRIIIIGIVAFMAIAAGTVWWKISSSPLPQKRQQIVPVRVERMKSEVLAQSLQLSGEIIPEKQSDIYSRVVGSVKNMKKNIGDHCTAGEVIANIEDYSFRTSVQQAEATLRQSQAALIVAKQTLERITALTAKSFSSKQELDVAEAQYLAAKAKAEADSAAAENARITLSYCAVTAPFTGYISRRYVDPGATATVQNPLLYTMVDNSALRIRVEIPEKNIALLDKHTAELIADAVPDEVFEATLLRSNAALDRSSRTLAAEFRISDLKHRLKPGMYATLRIRSGYDVEKLTVPKEAVLSDGVDAFVMIAAKNTDGKIIATKKIVRTGISNDLRIEILDGITPNDNVITAGLQNTRDKSEITIKK